MKVSKFSEQQIAMILKQVDDGLGLDCVPQGRHFTTDLLPLTSKVRWPDTLGSQMAKQLEDENRRLNQMVADLSLDKAMLQDVLQKKL